jgi:hypothetical protein
MPGDAPTRHERGEPEGGDARRELDDEEGERRDLRHGTLADDGADAP